MQSHRRNDSVKFFCAHSLFGGNAEKLFVNLILILVRKVVADLDGGVDDGILVVLVVQGDLLFQGSCGSKRALPFRAGKDLRDLLADAVQFGIRDIGGDAVAVAAVFHALGKVLKGDAVVRNDGAHRFDTLLHRKHGGRKREAALIGASHAHGDRKHLGVLFRKGSKFIRKHLARVVRKVHGVCPCLFSREERFFQEIVFRTGGVQSAEVHAGGLCLSRGNDLGDPLKHFGRFFVMEIFHTDGRKRKLHAKREVLHARESADRRIHRRLIGYRHGKNAVFDSGSTGTEQ